jgi:putative ABC transport system permease protein
VSLTDWGLETVKPGRLRLRSAFALYRVRLRRRWVQELLAVIGIAVGVALLYATQVASTSLAGPVRDLNAGLVGKSQLMLMARGSVPFSESTYDRVIALPGVRRAAPLLQVPANVIGPRGEQGVTLYGADPRIVKLRGTLLEGFDSDEAARQESLVMPAPIALAIGSRFGDDVRLQIAGHTVTSPVATVNRKEIGALVDSSIMLAPLAFLQRLTGVSHRVTRILVEAEPGRTGEVRDGLRRLAGTRLDVQDTAREWRLFDQAARPFNQASVIFSVLSALVGFLFAVCALLVTAADRRKLAVQQRDQGYPPSATLMTLLVDAAVIGFVGVALGLLGGEVLSRRGFTSDVSFFSGAFPIGNLRIVTWQCVAIAAAGGLLAAAVGVLAPVGGVVRAALPAGLRPRRQEGPPSAAAEHGRRVGGLLLGVVCLVVALAITIGAPGAAVVGLVALALALVLLLPLLLGWVIAVLARCNSGRRSLVAVVLALQQLQARRWRTRALAIATTGAIAVFGAASLQGARHNVQGGLDVLAHDLSSVAAVWAAPPGAGSAIGTTSFPPGEERRLARLPGVRAVALYRAGLLDVADRRAWVIGAAPDAPAPVPRHQVLEGDATIAAARVHAGGWATVSRALADDLQLGVGDRFALPSPHPLTLRVAAITTNLGWSAGALVLGSADFTRAWGDGAIAAYHARLEPGTTPATARAEIAAALGPRSGLRVETADQRAGRQSAVSRSGLSRLKQIAALTLIAAVLAMSAAMTGLLWQHRSVIADLKLHGLRTGLLWRALVIETGVLFGTGALAGGVFALLGQVLCTRGVQVVTGYPVVDGLQPDILISSVGLVIGASLLVVAVPGLLVAKARPAWRD